MSGGGEIININSIITIFDKTFPVESCDLHAHRNNLSQREIETFYNCRNNSWLEYGKLCFHDDGFMCNTRMEAIRLYMIKLLTDIEPNKEGKMRGTRAKHLRRLIYGEQSQKQVRSYIRTEKGTIIAQGLRRLYQELKARYKGRR